MLKKREVELEAASRFELENNDFADRCLTTWLCRPKSGRKRTEKKSGFSGTDTKETLKIGARDGT
jgi:hypothetical protein